jgi:tetratricopeptide (TPR) repeat protein
VYSLGSNIPAMICKMFNASRRLHVLRRAILGVRMRPAFRRKLTCCKGVLDPAKPLLVNFWEQAWKPLLGFLPAVRGILNRAQAPASISGVRVIRLKPDYAEAYFNRGNSYLNSKRYGDAISDFSEAIRRMPHDGKTYQNRSIAYRLMGRFKAAKSDLEKAQQLGVGSN